MNINWKYKLIIGLSAIFCLSYYFDSKSKTDLQSSLSKFRTGESELVGYNPAPMIAGIGLLVLLIWLAYPYIVSWVEKYNEYYDSNNTPEIDE